MKTLASVAATGAITPVGLRSVDTAFSHRAAAPAMREAPLVDAQGEPITMCFLPIFDPSLVGEGRALAIAARALDEVSLALGPAARSLRARLVLATGERLARKRVGSGTAAAWLAGELVGQVRGRFAELGGEALARGPAGPAYALPELAKALGAGVVDLAILGGVHTDYDPDRIAELSAQSRLYAPDNLDALIPGEAAAFVALMRPDMVRRLRLTEKAEIWTAATAYEKARPDNDAPAFQAAGLTAALRTVLAPLADTGARAGWVLTDLTFETFRHFELQAAMTRTARLFCEPQQVESPAQRMGNLGAAAMPLHIALAAEAYTRGYAPHAHVVCIAGSESGERGALLLSSPRD